LSLPGTVGGVGLRRVKEIKVKIPIDQHLRLHTLKLTQGVTISEAVERALQRFLDEEAPETASRAVELAALESD
jgi:ribosomal protein S13